VPPALKRPHTCLFARCFACRDMTMQCEGAQREFGDRVHQGNSWLSYLAALIEDASLWGRRSIPFKATDTETFNQELATHC
jgi:hypothetical protein